MGMLKMDVRTHKDTTVLTMPERVIKIPFSNTATATKETGVTLLAGTLVTDIAVKVTTLFAAGTLDVGLSTAALGYTDNLIDGAVTAATGWTFQQELVSGFMSGEGSVESAAGLVAATNDSTLIGIGSAFYYTINGQRYYKAITDDWLDPIGQDGSATGKFNVSYIYIDAAGTGSIRNGTEGATLATCVWPTPIAQDGKVCVGTLSVTDSAAWTGGTFDFGDVTETFIDAVTGTNDAAMGLSLSSDSRVLGKRLTADAAVRYVTNDKAASGFIYITVRAFE